MTSNKFSSKSFLRHRITSHWYLSLISAILFFLGGPFVLLMSYSQTKNYYGSDNSTPSLNEQLLEVTKRFFERSDSAFTYVIAYAVATIIALVLFSYLNSKKQINFYHSQPLSRKKLFISNYVASLLLGVLPLIVMFLLSAALAIGTVGFGSYLSTIPMHTLGLIAFYSAGLSITALACQLTGSTIFAMYTMGFLNFFLPATTLLICTLLSEFSSTLYVDTGFITYLSPVTYFITEIIGFINVFTVIELLAYSLLALVLAFLSYGLYLIRPSEVTGNTIVFKPLGAFIKYVSAFVFSVLFGMITSDTGGGFNLFVVVFGGFMFISCLFMEVAFRRSFRVIKNILPSCIIATIVAIGGIFALSSLSQSLDTKVPDASNVKLMSFNFVNQHINSYINGTGEEIGKIDDPELISESINIINKIIADSNYRTSTRSLVKTASLSQEEGLHHTSIIVRYNDSLVSRTYYGVNVDLIMQELSKIYENSTYKDTIIKPLENSLSENIPVSWLSINTTFPNDYIFSYNYDLPRNEGDYIQDDKYIRSLINALITDIRNSKYDDLIKERQYYGNMNITIEGDDTQKRYLSFNSELYDSFVNVHTVISTMIADPDYAQFVRIDDNADNYKKDYSPSIEVTTLEPVSAVTQITPENTQTDDTENTELEPVVQ